MFTTILLNLGVCLFDDQTNKDGMKITINTRQQFDLNINCGQNKNINLDKTKTNSIVRLKQLRFRFNLI